MSPDLSYLAILVVLIPLVGGVLAPLLGRGIGGWLLALVTTAATTFVSGYLLFYILGKNAVAAPFAVSYPIGGWPPPFGIELKVDLLSALLATLVAAIGFIVTLFSRQGVDDEIPADRRRFFWSLWLLAITGLLGILVTGDAFNVYVLLELSSLTIYGLIAMGRSRSRQALTAALNYLVLGSVGASFILIAIGLLYAKTGTLNMADIHARLLLAPVDATVLTARAFLLAGVALKMALFPLHLWMPAAYAKAPSAVAALLAATATKVGIYMAMRFIFSVFAVTGGAVLSDANVFILSSCCGAAIIFGSLAAARQPSLSLLLAYSSVAQIGYIVVGMTVGHIDAMTGSILHMIFHALMKGGLFLCAGILIYRLGSTRLTDLAGLGQRMPWVSGAIVVGGLGMIGIPGTAGFVSKFYLLKGLILSGHPVLAGLVLGGSVLAAIYTWRFVEIAYLQPAKELPENPRGLPIEKFIPVIVLLGASIVLGLTPGPIVDVARDAALQLLGGTP
ncbi:MAG: cation:proton antiporter [Planctomycetes bacterium]|nr:cation:proton antiporter [Planctomycetota bacterium]